jgi:putative transcriptional regulator
MPHLNPAKGLILVAEPSVLGDVNFNRSVILLTDENPDGFVGFILNKPLDYTVNDLIPHIESEFTIFHGGPVEEDNIYFIHRRPDLIPDSVEIADGIYWGANFEIVTILLNNKIIEEDEIRFFLGYSGWGYQQLHDEISLNSWVVIKNTHGSDILSKNNKTFWKEKMLEFGGEYPLWANAPANPDYN